MTHDHSQLLFEAGRAAANRGWSDALVVDIEALDDQGPIGPPLIIAALSEEVTTRAAKELSALAGAGRQVMLVTDRPLPDHVSAWLPEGALQVTAQDLQAVPRTPTDPARPVKDARTTLTNKLVKAVADRPGRGSAQSWLALNGGFHARMVLAADPKTDPALLSVFASMFLDAAEPADDEHPFLLSSLVVNSALSPEVLESLERECDSVNLHRLLANPSISSDRIRAAASSDDFLIREDAARNPAAPADVLLQLSNDSVDWVRAAVAANPSISVELLVQGYPSSFGLSGLKGGLICDSHSAVRAAVATNPSTPTWLLEALADQPAVREAVVANPSTPSSVIRRCCVGQLTAVAAANPNAPAVLLESLASQKNPKIQTAIAANPNTPAEVVRRLVDLDDAETNLAITSNPNAPQDVLTQVLKRAIQRDAWNQVVNLSLNPSTRDSDLAKIVRARGRL